MDKSHKGPPVANLPEAPSSDEEVHFDDKIFREIEDYVMEVKREKQVQASDFPLYGLALDVRWSERASSSGGAKPSTIGALSTDPNSRYIYEDWVFGLLSKKLGFISREFRLGNLASWAAENEISHLPPHHYMAFNEAILKMGVYLPFHPFIVQVLDYFGVVPFQLPLNSYRLIVAFYIVFLEYCGVAPSVVHFAYIYGLKALAKYARFWYLTNWGDSMGITTLPK